MNSVVTVTLSNGEVWLTLDGASARIYACGPFREWFAREFGERAPLACVWNAIRVPGWLLYSATQVVRSETFVDRESECAAHIAKAAAFWASTAEQPDDCDDIRTALPAELLEAFFAEILAS
ncbi:MAG: hypothetical protein E6Q97_01770 [Desulfurellales bacterium]|nr:MAG: hypothetical protein E6Q97_01770 [Desulfurellales bacterium]